jgi:hypothetical protein
MRSKGCRLTAGEFGSLQAEHLVPSALHAGTEPGMWQQVQPQQCAALGRMGASQAVLHTNTSASIAAGTGSSVVLCAPATVTWVNAPLVPLRAVWEEGCTCCPGRSAQTKSHRSGTYVTVELQVNAPATSQCSQHTQHSQQLSWALCCVLPVGVISTSTASAADASAVWVM